MTGTRQGNLQITVNGHPHRVEAPPDTPLLHVLRDELGLSSPKFGCGISRCGACTVHVAGEPVRSCGVPVAAVAGQEVVTLEGLGKRENPHPLQRAFLDEQAGQCGYCLPGVIMQAAHLLAHASRPTEAEIRTALSDTLCRCGAHVRIVRAVQRAAEMTS